MNMNDSPITTPASPAPSAQPTASASSVTPSAPSAPSAFSSPSSTPSSSGSDSPTSSSNGTASDDDLFGQALSERQKARSESPKDEFESGSSTDKNDSDKNTPTRHKAPKENHDDKSGGKTDVKQTQNSLNAARRIKNKRCFDTLNSRISALEEELEQYKEYADAHPEMKLRADAAAEQTRGRIDDLRAVKQQQQAQDYYDDATQTFGAQDAEKFMQDSARYAQQVNEREPELCKFINRPYGKILLREWFDKMDRPDLNEQWERLTPYEKQIALTHDYNKIIGVFQRIETRKKSGSQQSNGGNPSATAANPGLHIEPSNPSANPQDVPVPGSGRNVNGTPGPDEFGMAWQEAVNRRRNEMR